MKKHYCMILDTMKEGRKEGTNERHAKEYKDIPRKKRNKNILKHEIMWN